MSWAARLEKGTVERATPLDQLIIASSSANISSQVVSEVVRYNEFGKYTPAGCVKRAIDWTQKVGESRIDGQTLIDALRYDGSSLWWFGHTLLFASAKEAISKIEQTQRILDTKSPAHVQVLGLGKVGKLIVQVCERNHIPCIQKASPEWPAQERFVDEFKILGGRLLLHVKEFRRRRLSQRSDKEGMSRSPRILFLSPAVNWRSVWDHEGMREEKKDVFMGSVMEEIRGRGYDVVCVDVDYSLGGRIDTLRDKVQRSQWGWIPFERYINHDALARLKTNPNFERLGMTFVRLRESAEFKDALQYQSVPLWDFLESRFRRLLSGIHLLEYARILEGAREMIKTMKPSAIAMTYETGAYAKAVIVAAQEAGVPTLGIQHGFISPDSVEYVHRRTAVTRFQDGCPIPTKTAVGGTYTAQLLTELSSYPNESVVVTGHPRHDDLVFLKRHGLRHQKNEVLERLGLDASKKTIMIASGGFHSKYGWSREYDLEILNSMLDMLSCHEDLQMVVRLHPREDGRIQAEIIRQRRGAAVIARGERNDLLWASDLFVTVNSSTALDAMILGKPVFMLNLVDENVPTIDLGDAATKCKIEDLRTHIEGAIYNAGAVTPRSVVEKQLEKHANTVDGNASNRVARLLDEMAGKDQLQIMR
jgi:hypothetical protein